MIPPINLALLDYMYLMLLIGIIREGRSIIL